MKAEMQLMEGGNLYLSPKEQQVDEKLLKLKEESFKDGIKNSLNYAPSLHFFDAKPIIEKSEIFKYIKRMPKGGNLHLHNRWVSFGEGPSGKVETIIYIFTVQVWVLNGSSKI